MVAAGAPPAPASVPAGCGWLQAKTRKSRAKTAMRQGREGRNLESSVSMGIPPVPAEEVATGPLVPAELPIGPSFSPLGRGGYHLPAGPPSRSPGPPGPGLAARPSQGAMNHHEGTAAQTPARAAAARRRDGPLLRHRLVRLTPALAAHLHRSRRPHRLHVGGRRGDLSP